MYGGCQEKVCVSEGGDEKCVSPTHIELDPDYVGVKCYKIYKKYYDYYGSFTYADKWVTAAVEGAVFLQGGTVTNRLADFSQARLQSPRFYRCPPLSIAQSHSDPPPPSNPQPPPSLPTLHLPPPPSTLLPPSLHHPSPHPSGLKRDAEGGGGHGVGFHGNVDVRNPRVRGWD